MLRFFVSLVNICPQKFQNRAFRGQSLFVGIAEQRRDKFGILGSVSPIAYGKIGAAGDGVKTILINDKYVGVMPAGSLLCAFQRNDGTDAIVADDLKLIFVFV